MVRRRHLLLLAGLLTCLPGSVARSAPSLQARGGASIPADFAQYLVPPGKLTQVKRPGRVLFDPVAKELFLADIGNNRVLVFDSNNVFRFQFFGNEHITAPMDLAVAGDGTLFVLGMAKGAWRIIRFDFDGLYQGSMAIPAAKGQATPEVSSMAMGRDGRLFLLNDPAHEILVMDTSGALLRRIEVAGGMSPKDRKDIIYGSLSAWDSLLFVPMASFGTVAVYTQAGRHLRNLGSKGSAPGEMNFPISVAVNGDSVIHVLDKNRFNVLCFRMDGLFLGEFGGKGMSAGWFYHPQRIAINARNQIVVAQIMKGIIQVCEPPDFLMPDTLDLLK